MQQGGDGTDRPLIDETSDAPLLTSPTPPIQFTVQFDPSTSANPDGPELTVHTVKPEPKVTWNPAPAAASPYTLIMWDPDAPAKSWLHWLVVNATGLNPSSGTEIVPWAPPTPPYNTGQHRYIFGVFQQSAPIDLPQPPARSSFSPTAFAEAHGLQALAYTGLRVKTT